MHVIFTSEPNVGAVIGVTLFTLLIPLAVYVWVALALGAVFRKTGEPAWKAWVPILNSWTLLELGGQAGWWAILALLPVVNVVAVVFTIIAIHAINGRFGLGGGYTVLGALVFPVWASIVGWGSARPLTGIGGVESTGYEPRPAPPAWQPAGPAAPAPAFAAAPPPPPAFPAAPPPPPAPPAFAAAPPPPPPAFAPAPPAPPAFSPAPPAPPVPPAAAAAPAYAPAPAFAPPPAPPAAAVPPPPPPPPAPIAPPPPPATGPAPVAAADAWAPPPAAAPTAAEPTTALPVVPAPAPEPAVDEDDERTVITQKRRREHRLVLPTGTEVTLTGDTVLLGRAPVAAPGTAAAQIVPVSDDTKTISKTHAVLRRTAEGWSIEDLGSTNGTALVQDDAEIELVGIQPLTERFFLGDAELRIVEA